MKGFKQCSKGHFFKDTMNECPYCPNGGTSTGNDKTEVLGGGDNQKTSANMDAQKTQVFGGATESASSSSSSSNQSFDATKTIIGGGDTNYGDAKDKKEVSRRKLRGWLVSFDIEEFGMDYRIIEGRNTVGSNSSNDVTVQDGEVSGMHALILCKKDKFIITDELSSNGTLLNGEDLTPREPFSLNDGDEIRIGTTNLLFKTAFKK
tara:strand:- start:182 stop:799 length:618 start_codon:yes stop_codon:yes gene_type:complete